jgi:hypothetical protein
MFRRALSYAALAAALATAAPAFAMSDDPVAPSADDPSAATWVNERGPARKFERSTALTDDPSAYWSSAATVVSTEAKKADCACSCASKPHHHA